MAKNNNEKNAALQPHTYLVQLAKGGGVCTVSGARYVEQDNGSLIICAVNEDETKPEYNEVARFSAGSWLSIAIMEYCE